MNIKPLTTEKAVMLIEKENILTFETSREETKEMLKKEIEGMFDVKIEKIRTLIRNGKKYSYVKRFYFFSNPVITKSTSTSFKSFTTNSGVLKKALFLTFPVKIISFPRMSSLSNSK